MCFFDLGAGEVGASVYEGVYRQLGRKLRLETRRIGFVRAVEDDTNISDG